jgi:hypothetical protein
MPAIILYIQQLALYGPTHLLLLPNGLVFMWLFFHSFYVNMAEEALVILGLKLRKKANMIVRPLGKNAINGNSYSIPSFLEAPTTFRTLYFLEIITNV